MKILYITPSLPNDYARIRTKNILKALQKIGEDVTLVSLYSSKKDLIYYDEAKKLVNKIILFKKSKILSLIQCCICLFCPFPLRTAYVWNHKMHSYFKKLNQDEYDMIYIKRLRMAQYARYFKKEKVYIDITDSLTKYYDRIRKETFGLSKLLNEEEYFKHRNYEIKIAKTYQTIICSEDDKKYLEDINHTQLNSMLVMCNSIDTDKWKTDRIKVNAKGGRKKLVFSGMMDYEPNILAAKYIINDIVPKLSVDYEISLVGKKCPTQLKKLEKTNVHFTGYVEDMKKELMKNDIYLCPIVAGSGIKNKIFQAGCSGLPIISTSMGLEGLPDEMKKYAFIANTPEEFIDRIEEINHMEENELIERIQKQQKYMIEHYDIIVEIKKLVDKVR